MLPKCTIRIKKIVISKILLLTQLNTLKTHYKIKSRANTNIVQITDFYVQLVAILHPQYT